MRLDELIEKALDEAHETDLPVRVELHGRNGVALRWFKKLDLALDFLEAKSASDPGLTAFVFLPHPSRSGERYHSRTYRGGRYTVHKVPKRGRPSMKETIQS